MATVMTYGYCVTQAMDYMVNISKNGRVVMRLKYSRPLSGEELDYLAFCALLR